MGYRILLFDCDRTLLNFYSAMRAAITKLYLKYGAAKVTEEMIDFYDAWNNSLWERLENGEISKEELVYSRFPVICARYGLNYPGKGKMETDYILFLSEGHELMPGAKETLEALHGKYRMYIVSNGFLDVQTRRVEESGLKEYLEGSFISEEVGYAKPDGKFFDVVMERLGNPDRKECLIIGDSMSADIQGGVNAGIDTILVSTKKPTGYEYSPTYVVEKLTDIPSLLNQV